MEQTTGRGRRRGWWRSGRESFFSVKTAVIVVTVALTWVFALGETKRLPAPGIVGDGTASACPSCRRHESPCAPNRPAVPPERQ